MKYHAIHPYFAPVATFIAFAIAFTYPQEHWQKLFEEPNYIHLHLASLIFMTLCLSGLYLGMSLGRPNNPPKKTINQNQQTNTILPVLFVTLLALSSYIFYLYTNFPGFIFLAITGGGATAKSMIADDIVNFSSLPTYAIPIIWWAWYKIFSGAPTTKQKAVKSLAFITTAILVITLIINVSRFSMMPLIIGLFIIYTYHKAFSHDNKTNHLRKSLLLMSALATLIIIVFLLFTFSRGSTALDSVIQAVLGYGPTSFNRLAAVLEGNLTFEYSKTGAYLIPEPILSIINRLAGETHTSSLDVWLSEFNAVGQSGLNENYIWLTLPGYIFDSIGYPAPFYFIILGFCASILWRAFLAGKTYGIILYPLIYFSILSIFSSNYFILFAPSYVLIAIIIHVWENLPRIIATTTNQPKDPRHDYFSRNSHIQSRRIRATKN